MPGSSPRPGAATGDAQRRERQQGVDGERQRAAGGDPSQAGHD